MKTNRLKALLALMTLSSSLSYAGMTEDTAITAAVKAKLLLEKDIPAASIQVTTKDNVVYLNGGVATGLQADKAIELAASMDSVADVNYDNLKVNDSKSIAVNDSKSTTSDNLITAKVKGRITQLFNDKKISPNYSLKAETNNKEVHIFGTVSNSADIGTIESEVKKIRNVDSVRTNISVK